MAPLRVIHISTGLYTGGAETMLERLVDRVDRSRFETVVVSLKDEGTIGPRIAARGIDVVSLGTHRLPTPVAIRRLRRTLRELAPDVVQTWALFANVLGGGGARHAGVGPIAWSVHHSGNDLASFGPKVRATQALERRMAGRVPARIIACSQSSAEMMRALHYPMSKVEVIANGFDLDRFRPDPQAREGRRAELGIAADEYVVGHVARFHPVKGHDVLLAAARRVAEREPRARFVLYGNGVDAQNPALADAAAALGDRVLLLGEAADMEAIYPAFDVFVSSSRTEALPLAVGEAMACGVPVVATDCGDSAAMVGDSGRVVGVGDSPALAEAILELARLDTEGLRRLGAEARSRIEAHYSLDAMTVAYEAAWSELASTRS